MTNLELHDNDIMMLDELTWPIAALGYYLPLYNNLAIYYLKASYFKASGLSSGYSIAGSISTIGYFLTLIIEANNTTITPNKNPDTALQAPDKCQFTTDVMESDSDMV